MRVDTKIFFITLLVIAGLISCNRSKFGGSGDETSRSAGVSIDVKKITSSSPTAKGKGQLQLYAAYPLSITCTNCAALGFALSFVDAPVTLNQYAYTADFDYSMVTQTEVCALTLNVVSKSSSKINVVKTYNVYVCPRQGMEEKCDIDNAVPSCAHIGR